MEGERWASTGVMLVLTVCHPSATAFPERSTDALPTAETHFHTPPSSSHLSLGNLQVRSTVREEKNF